MLHNWRKLSTLTGAILLLGCFSSLNAADHEIDPSRNRECYTCEGINCLRTTRLNVTVTCTDLLDICVTIFDASAVVVKGCYLDIPEEHRFKCDERNNPECVKCFGQRCNNKGRNDFKCIDCNSDDNSKCSVDTAEMTAISCPIPTSPNSYCYVRHSGGSKVVRGCLVHQKEQIDCLNDAKCSMCLSDDAEACNSYKLGSSGAKAIVFNLSGLLLLLFVKLLQ